MSKRTQNLSKEEPMKYTLDTDFSSLSGPKAANWIMGFQDMAEDAFADSSSHSRLLGNLLILEPYLHTIRQGLADRGRTVPAILQEALDILWDYLEGRKAPSDFQDFANNLYAATLNYNVREEITDAQAKFYEKHVDIPWGSTCEWQILTWLSVLLLEVVYLVLGDYACEKKDTYFCRPEELHWSGGYLLVEAMERTRRGWGIWTYVNTLNKKSRKIMLLS